MFDIANIKDYLLLIFYFTYAVLLPGYLLARLVIAPAQLRKLLGTLPNIEKNLVYRYFYYLFAPAIGLILVDAVVLLFGKFNLTLSFDNFFATFSLLNVAFLIVNIFFVKRSKPIEANQSSSINKIFIFIFILVFLASALIRTVFYLPDAVPQNIDLGHHMYWSELMVHSEKFPVYTTSEVIEGEHMVFAVLSKLTGITLLSAMPLIILSFYNLMMLLALFFCSMAITANRKIALWSLFFSGIYFAVDPPQARYVKGGVIGNTFGNLFIPLVFLLVFLFFRYFFKYLIQNKDTITRRSYKPVISVISLILVIVIGSFYTHHLSTFLLGITLAVSFVSWIIATFVLYKGASKILFDFFRRIIFSAKFILTLLAVAIFPLFIYIPYYLRNNAVNTVTKAPSKVTHLGIPLTDLPGKLGWERFFLLAAAILSLALYSLIFLAKKYKIGEKMFSWKFFHSLRKGLESVSTKNIFLLFFGWLFPLALLSFYPKLTRIDLPSRRVINYLVFPSLILGAVIANLIFSWIKKNFRGRLFIVILGILGSIIIWDGTADFRNAYTGQNKFQGAVELYNASSYLASHTYSNAIMLKDHRTISGDSWIKFFLLRGYDYFLSRTYDYKYNDASNNLDPCTKEMIMVPGSSTSQKCYGQTRINYVIVKPTGDEFLFWKGQGFNAVYLNDDITIFSTVKN